MSLAGCRFPNLVGQLAALGMVNVVSEGELGSDRLIEQLFDARVCRGGRIWRVKLRTPARRS